MLTLSRKADYGLMSLAYMAEREGEVCSAREIAEARGLPLPLLMNILKTLHQHGVLTSRRGVKGGYQVGIDLDSMSLCEFIAIVECEDHGGECHCRETQVGTSLGRDAMYSPVLALQEKLRGFMKQVKLSDLIVPGRRIDVPVGRVKLNKVKANV